MNVSRTNKPCAAKSSKGAPCAMPALRSGRYCWAHDPARSAERLASRKLGGLHRGRARVSGDAVTIVCLADVLTLVNAVIADSWTLDNSPARSRVLLAAADSARGILEVSELEKRIERLEKKP